MDSSAAEMETEAERESRKRPRVAAAEDPSLAAVAEAGDPSLAAAAEYAAWLERMAETRRAHEVKSAAFRKKLLANPLTPEQLREREEAAWDKYNNESWERVRDNWIWPPFEADSKQLTLIPKLYLLTRTARIDAAKIPYSIHIWVAPYLFYTESRAI